MVETGTHTEPSRIINVSACYAKWGRSNIDDQENFGRSDWGLRFSPFNLLSQSKAAQIYHVLEMARLAKKRGENVISVSLHPGFTDTAFYRFLANRLEYNIYKCCVYLFGEKELQEAITI